MRSTNWRFSSEDRYYLVSSVSVAALDGLPYSLRMSNKVAAPPAPPNGPSDWAAAVHGNCVTNLQRLGLWTGGTTPVFPGADPSGCFKPVAPGSLGRGKAPVTIYVVTHGWAPGYRGVVEQAGGDLLWWSSSASVDREWASYWAWSPVTAPLSPPFPICGGLLPSIVAWDPYAVALAYSWIDDSATDGGYIDKDEVYQSEAYTNINGLRLANALDQAIAKSFWDSPFGLLHLIGHSHGSKVATVAALTLQNRGRKVAQRLTILDAPESLWARDANAANFLGIYLEPMQIADPSVKDDAGIFVDNYASYFGVGYTGSSKLQKVVEVALAPSQLYDPGDLGDLHTYAAAFYAGAADGSKSQQEPLLGLAWPPPPPVYQPALNQNWPKGTTQKSQWWLQAGASIIGSCSYGTTPVEITGGTYQGNVVGSPATALTFGSAGPWPAYSIFSGYYWNPADGDGYGVAFDVLWTAPQPGDYLVVTSEAQDFAEEVLVVMDGVSAPWGVNLVSFNADVSSVFFGVQFYIYYLAAAGNLSGKVIVSNFRLVEVGSDDFSLRRKRLARPSAPTAGP
jgi:hypothetical protein